MFVCVCGSGGESACMHALVCVRVWGGKRSLSGIFLSDVPFSNSLRQGLSLTSELIDLASLASQDAPGILSLLPRSWHYRHLATSA